MNKSRIFVLNMFDGQQMEAVDDAKIPIGDSDLHFCVDGRGEENYVILSVLDDIR